MRIGLVLLVLWAMPAAAQDYLTGLSDADRQAADDGRDEFTTADTPVEGLGPVFTGKSCVTCHFLGGPGGAGPITETRFLLPGEPNANGGHLRHPHGISDPDQNGGQPVPYRYYSTVFVKKTIKVGLRWTTTTVPQTTTNLVYFFGEPLPPNASLVVQRRSKPLFGLGLRDAVDSDDVGQVYVFQHSFFPDLAGRAAVVTDVNGQPRLGRFGVKGQRATLFQFCCDAQANEIGVSNGVFPGETPPYGMTTNVMAALPIGSPNQPTSDDATSYASFLQALDFLPPSDPNVFSKLTRGGVPGSAEFLDCRCFVCHWPRFVTGSSPGGLTAAEGVEAWLFSDLLLHDMGSLADGLAQGDAGPTEMLTPTLRNLAVQGPLLHDRRANGQHDVWSWLGRPGDALGPSGSPEAIIDEAILMHEGQGGGSKLDYFNLPRDARQRLVSFLKGL